MAAAGKIVLIVLIFGTFVFFHELGHFLTAKAFKMKVNDFSLGFGPALFRFQKGDTTYALRAFPLGGYVVLEGEEEESDDIRSFPHQALWKRFIVMIAGSIMNLILGFFVVIAVLNLQPVLGSTTISSFRQQATSNSALQVGDRILRINNQRIHIDNDIVFGLVRDEDGLVDVEVERAGERLSLQVPFQVTQGAKDDLHSVYIDFTVLPTEKTMGAILSNSFYYCGTIAKSVWVSLIDLVSGKYGMAQLSGPVGVSVVIGQAISQGLRPALTLIAFISINLGIFNLLPLPALDGGKLLFLTIEGLRGRPVPEKYESYVHMVGMGLLFTLMLFVTYNDIVKLFH